MAIAVIRSELDGTVVVVRKKNALHNIKLFVSNNIFSMYIVNGTSIKHTVKSMNANTNMKKVDVCLSRFCQ